MLPLVMFNKPAFLIVAAAILPVFLIFSLLMRRYQKRTLGKFGRADVLKRFSRFTPKFATSLVLALALALTALGASEPRAKNQEDLASKTLNAIIVLDVSRSMLAQDGPDGKTRLQVGIEAAEQLFAAYPDGRFGLVLYTDRVARFQPTPDQEALRIILDDTLENYHVRGEGSSMVWALTSAAQLVEETPYTVDVLILISDGGKSLSSLINAPLSDALAKVKEAHVRMVVGATGEVVPVPIPVYQDGKLVGYHQYSGATAYTALDEDLLRQVALETGGYYQHIKSANDLVNVVRSQKLDDQPMAQANEKSLVSYPISLALFLVAVWLLGKNFKRIARPRIFRR